MVETYGHIKPEDFKKFRKGKFENASKEVQEKWKYVGLYLINKVNTAWTSKAMRRQKLLSEVVSITDEAIVGWLFHSFFGEWNMRYEELQKAQAEGDDVPKKKGKKQSGKGHASKKELAEFFRRVVWLEHLHNENMKDETIGWDKALQRVEQKELEEKMRGKRHGEENNQEKKSKKPKKPKNWFDDEPGFDASMISYGNINRTVI